MSVYIKGIDMPLNREGCETIIRIQPDGTVLNLQGIHLYATAIQVPPHGRLIDADALENLHTQLGYKEDKYSFHITARAWVKDALTIIEAEE